MVTKEKFLRYRKVQMKGKYNMITEALAACKEMGCSWDDYLDILENYGKYMNEFNIK